MPDGEIRAAYLAAPGFETPLAEELARKTIAVTGSHGRLLLSPDSPVHAAWALDIWTNPQLLPAPSVKVAADGLRAIQRNWSGFQALHHRRAALIAERLPPLRPHKLRFPEPAPTAHLGGWTLLDSETILASATKTSPFLQGECLFEEDREEPPSRAYLKLWEACTRAGLYARPGDTCFDLGASPGGWSWAMARMGASVTAVDKAPLAPRVAGMPNVRWQQGSAFALPPQKVDWLISDIIAYPDRLLRLMQQWIDADAPRHIICTIKFQGQTDHETAAAFAGLPGGQVMHLLHNKHELTFMWSKEGFPCVDHHPHLAIQRQAR